MREDIVKALKEPHTNNLAGAVLDVLAPMLKKSRNDMGANYATWDARQAEYMHRRLPDKSDKEAASQGLPTKLTMPIMYSQVNSFVAFGYMMFTQRERFYEFPAVAPEDQDLRECCELTVERDIQANCFRQTLVQNLIHLGVMGLFVNKDWWNVEKVWLPIRREVEPVLGATGVPVSDATFVDEISEVTRREGNVIRGVSPYRFFPDTSFTPAEWLSRGQFVATDEEFSRDALKDLEARGVVAGIDHVKDYPREKKIDAGRGKARFGSIDLTKSSTANENVVITEVIVNWVPANIQRDGKKLSDATHIEKWLVWIANDSRVVRLEPLNYYHCQFPVSVGVFMPDVHESDFSSVASSVGDFQGLISWLMNSRMAAVTRTVDNQLVVDPVGIETADIAARHRIIRMRKAASGKDVRRYIMPLQATDSTQSHVADMNTLVGMIQMVTGVNDNAMGQYNGGRRSATEARNVTNAAAARMKMILSVVWDMAYRPQGNRLLTNHRQFISPEEFNVVCGPSKQDKFEAFKSTPEQLVRAYDYSTFDGTLASEKMFLAQQLQEVLMLLISNPMSALSFGLSPDKMLKTVTELRGLGNMANFGMSPEEMQQLAASLAPQQPAV